MMKRMLAAVVLAVTLATVPTHAAGWYTYEQSYETGGWFYGTLGYAGQWFCYATGTWVPACQF